MVALKIIMLSKISQNQKDKCQKFYFIVKIYMKTQRHEVASVYLCIHVYTDMNKHKHMNKHTHIHEVGVGLNLYLVDLYSHNIIKDLTILLDK